MPAPPRSAYLHIPFCHRRCFYCDFAVVPLGDRADGAAGPGSASITAYLQLLLAEIAAAPGGPPLSTVYVGGGTPSLLSVEQLAGLLSALERRFGLAAGAEISLELDPAGFDQPRLDGYLAAGVNRVSLGGQSFDDAVLASLGRRHRCADLLEAAQRLQGARRRGRLRSWSLDLIQGLPGADRRHWQEQLEQALALAPPHLSVYDLIVEPGTVFAWRQQRGELALPDEDLAADLMDLTAARLAAAGYGRYEISNYALPGHASRHNRVYWSGAGWWGFGLGATAAPWGARQVRPRTRAAYASWLGQAPPTPGPEQVLRCQGELVSGMALEERLIVGLRRREGVHLPHLAAACGLSSVDVAALQQRLEGFVHSGHLLLEGPRWRLSDPAGLALSNAVLRELLAAWPPAAAL
ncbi:MAG: radical SAM family heme chaperone HemW [Synechococcaceae cyanobacterium]|nr:radical SAM family heme chaperone HemW [Synechococcaceae cyanobacterium]